MKRVAFLALLAAVTVAGASSWTSEAEAHGWRGRHVFVRLAPVYPVYTGYCRWYRSPYGLVKRCVY